MRTLEELAAAVRGDAKKKEKEAAALYETAAASADKRPLAELAAAAKAAARSRELPGPSTAAPAPALSTGFPIWPGVTLQAPAPAQAAAPTPVTTPLRELAAAANQEKTRTGRGGAAANAVESTNPRSADFVEERTVPAAEAYAAKLRQEIIEKPNRAAPVPAVSPLQGLAAAANQEKTRAGRGGAVTTPVESTNPYSADFVTERTVPAAEAYAAKLRQEKIKTAEAYEPVTETGKEAKNLVNQFSFGLLPGSRIGRAADIIEGTVSTAASNTAGGIAWLGDQTFGQIERSLGVVGPAQWLYSSVQGDKARSAAKLNAVKAGMSNTEQWFVDLGVSALEALPNMLLAVHTGGLSLGTTASLATTAASQGAGITQAVSSTLAKVATNPMYWTSFLRTAGSSYDHAISSGATETQAAAFSVINGLINAAVEVSGGVETLPARINGKATTSVLLDWIRSAAEEGNEEIVQGIIERLLGNVVLDEQRQAISISDPEAIVSLRAALEEWAGGAIVGGILSGGELGPMWGARGAASYELGAQTDAGNVGRAAAQTLETRAAEINRAIAQYGVRINVDDTGRLTGREALIDTRTGEITISPDMSTDDVLDFKVRHELGHAAASVDKTIVSDTLAAMRNAGFDVDAGVQRKLALYKERLAQRGELAAADSFYQADAEQEIFCDFIGAIAEDGELLRTTARTNPTLLQRIGEYIQAALDRLGVSLPGAQARQYARLAKDIRTLVGLENGRTGAVAGSERWSFDDKSYMEAVEAGDMETTRQMVDEAAKAAGYNVKAYHGTNAEFTVFDKNMIGSTYGQDNEGFFFLNEPDGARWVADDAVSGRGGEARVQEAMLRLSDPFVVTAEKSFSGMGYNPTGDPVNHYDQNTDEILYAAHEGDHDGIIVNGLPGEGDSEDLPGEVLYVAFEPEQIKDSAEVTYDDDGNIIPLSKRFDTSNSDIRYSFDEGDSTLVDELMPAPGIYSAEEWAARQKARSDAAAPPETQTPGAAELDDLVALLNETARINAPGNQQRSSADMVRAEAPKRDKSLGQKAEEAWGQFYRAMNDAGHSVTKIGKAAKDKSLYAYYNMARASSSTAAYMLTDEQTDVNGNKVGKGLNEILKHVRAKGDRYYEAFQLYLYDLHHADRMRRHNENSVQEAQRQLDAFDAEYPDIARLPEYKLEQEITSDGADADLAKTRIDLIASLRRAESTTNKPVLGYEVSAQDAIDEAEILLREHPEFEQLAGEVYGYIDNLMQYRVDSGLISSENAANLKKIYPHYVPTYRATEQKQGRGQKKNSVTVGSTVGRATGGEAALLPLHTALGRQTMSAVREGSKNRFGTRLLADYDSKNSGVSSYISDVQKYEAAFDPDSFDAETDPAPQRKNTFSVREDGKLWELTVDDSLMTAVEALSGANSRIANSNIARWTKRVNDFYKSLITGMNPLFTVRNAVRDFQSALFYSENTGRWAINYPQALAQIAKNGAMWKQYKALGGSFGSVFDYNQGVVREKSDAYNKTMGRIEAINMAVEAAPRLAEFMAHVKKYGSDPDTLMDAMLAAQDITVNFGRSGTVGKILNQSFVPFLNPGIQGFDKFVRTVAGKKFAKAWAGLVLKVAALGFAPRLLNELLHRDDDDWEELRDSDKDSNWLFKLKNGVWLKIPQGRELSVLGMTADRVVDLVNGEKVDWKDFIATVGNQIAPANPLKSNIISAFADSDLFDPNSPGRSWYGGDIESQRLQNYAPSQRYDASTDAVSKWLGGVTGLSPKKINYIIDQYSGVIGDFALPLLTPQAERNAFVKAFSIDGVLSNNISERFYNTSDELTYSKNDGDPLSGITLRYWSKQASLVSELNTQLREIENSTELSEREKREQARAIEEDINDIERYALASLEVYGDAVEKYYTGDSDKELDDAYRKANNEVFGSEYAISVYNKNVYENAQELHDKGVSYEDYYEAYFETRDIEPTKDSSGKTVATAAEKKRAWLATSDLDADTKASVYFGMSAFGASDKEKDLVAALETTGASAADVYDVCTQAKDAKATDGESAAAVKRDALLRSGLSQENKRTVYDALFGDENTERVEALAATGMNFDDFLTIYNKRAEIDDMDATAGQKAMELSYWLTGEGGYTAKQANVAENEFGFWSQTRGETTLYDALLGARITSTDARSLVYSLNALKPENGKTGVSANQKYRAVAESNLSEKEKGYALGVLMEETAYAKYQEATEAGISSKVYCQYLSGTSEIEADKDASGKSISGSKKAKVADYINSLSLTNAQKDELYLLAGYAKSGLYTAPWYTGRAAYTGNNPYNAAETGSNGQRPLDELFAAARASTGGSTQRPLSELFAAAKASAGGSTQRPLAELAEAAKASAGSAGGQRPLSELFAAVKAGAARN